MKVNRRTWTLLIVAVAVIGGVYAITVWQRGRETRRLLDELRSPDHAVAAQAMTSLRDRVPSVRKQLMQDAAGTTGPTRWRAIELLAEVKDAASRDALMNALQDADPTVRASAAMSLGKRGVRGAADRIAILAASDDELIEVRLAAIRALAMLGTATHVAEVASIATTRPAPPPEEPEEPVETEEAEAAEEVEAPAEPEEEWSDETAELRVEAVRTIATLGASARPEGAATGTSPAIEAVNVLTEACSPEEHNDEVRQAACYALTDLAELSTDGELRTLAIDALLEAADDEVGDVRIAAIHGLTLVTVPASRSDAVAKAMADALNDQHYWVRVAAGEEPIGG